MFALLVVADNVFDDTLLSLLDADNDVDVEVCMLHDVYTAAPTGVGCPFVGDAPPVEDFVDDDDHLPTRADAVVELSPELSGETRPA